MINWFDVSDESPNKDLALKNLKVTQNGTYGESGVAYSSVEVNVSGGGGSSDFSTAEVTFSSDGSDTFDLILHPFDSDQMLPVLDYNSGALIDDLSGISLESDNIEVSGSSVKRTVYIVKDSYVTVNQTDWGLVTVTGNAEIVPIEDNGDTYYLVKITGSCTIHSVGSK